MPLRRDPHLLGLGTVHFASNHRTSGHVEEILRTCKNPSVQPERITNPIWWLTLDFQTLATKNDKEARHGIPKTMYSCVGATTNFETNMFGKYRYVLK